MSYEGKKTTVRFELTNNGFANRPLKPLEYHSVMKLMAGAVRLELTTYGFGDRCSTN